MIKKYFFLNQHKKKTYQRYLDIRLKYKRQKEPKVTLNHKI